MGEIEAVQFILFEHAAGYCLFRVKEFEDTPLIVPQVVFFFFLFIIYNWYAKFFLILIEIRRTYVNGNSFILDR